MRPAVTFLFLAASLLAQDVKPLPEGASLDIVVQEVRGEVEVQAAPKTKWVAATPGLRLAPGARLCTGIGGEVILLFGTNSVAIVTEVSTFEIRSFGMKGDELVAEAFIDPGVAHVSVKQLEQFQTDFQVSTPRLTCSVKGSGYWIWSMGGAGMLDKGACDDHMAQIVLANLQQWVIAAGLSKDSGDDSPDDTQTRQHTTDVLPDGSTPREQVALLVALIANTLALDPGSLTLRASGSPTGGDTTRLQEFVQEHCSPEDIQRNLGVLTDGGHDNVVAFLETGDQQGFLFHAQLELDAINEGRSEDPGLEQAHLAFLELRLCLAAAQFLEDRTGIVTRSEGALLFTTIDNLDVLEHLARDAGPGGTTAQILSFDGGTDDIREDMFLYARRNGFPAFTNDIFLPFLDNRFLEDPDGLATADPPLFAQRRADFLDDGSGLSFNDLDEILAQADLEAHSPVSQNAMALLLMAMLHTEYHIIAYADPPGTGELEYDSDHTGFHAEFIRQLDDFRLARDYDRFLAFYVQELVEAWEDNTGCDEDPDVEDPCFDARRHFEDRLINVLTGFRGATGVFSGHQSKQEHDAIHVFVGFDDVRHHIEAEDVTDFLAGHQRREIEHQAADLIGLAASADIMDGRIHHEDFHDNNFFLEQQDPQEFQRRHDDFHDIANFGLDAFFQDWQAVQDQSRLETLLPETLGHALLDTVHKQFHLQMGTVPSGNQPGQYDFEHDDFHQNFLDPLHTTLGVDFAQFTHDLRDAAHLQWHDKTGVPLNPGAQNPGVAAHDHFHETLDQFHADMHAATGTGDGPQ